MRPRHMHARRIAILTAGGVASFVGIALWMSKPSLPTVRFADGRASRILKISFGTNHVYSPEPLWKTTLRSLLPDTFEKPLGPMKRYGHTTPYDSLAIYMESLQAQGGSRWLSMDVETGFPDGTVYGTKWSPSSYHPIVFDNYPRGEKEIAVRFWGTEIKVPNPRPVKRASWAARKLPQTNDVGSNQVILRRWRFLGGVKDGELQLEGRSGTGGRVGWMQWRTTLFDPWGNWTRRERERWQPSPGAKSERGFRLLAEGTEYISAGFIKPPVNQQYQTLRGNGRLTNWGVQFVGVFGPGTYEVSKDFEIKSSKRFARTNGLSVVGSSWMIECPDILAFSVSANPISEVRVRERLPDKRGRVFAGARAGSATQGGMVAQVFRSRVPTVTTNLEVEVIVRWPMTEFFIEKPQ